MIRTFHTSDTDKIMQLWLEGNEDAHPFIKKEYWQTHFPAVREQILDAEIFVYEENDKILDYSTKAASYKSSFATRSLYQTIHPPILIDQVLP